MARRNLVVLGAAGSVGRSTLDVAAQHEDKLCVYALAGNSNVEGMLELCLRHRPQHVIMQEDTAAKILSEKLRAHSTSANVETGVVALCELVAEEDVDIVLSAIVGAAGLQPTYAAIRAGKQVLIANKEPLVMTGDLFVKTAQQSGARLIPVDSEHNAIFQCLPAKNSSNGVARIHLTASGGPFRGMRWSDLSNVTPEQACAHPNWSMGPKISVDSATMMNKGLEFIEARSLFEVQADDIDIVIHPQSIVHSLVEYVDGSFLAQLGAPDMRIPIAHALAWPQRINSGAKRLQLTDLSALEFSAPEWDQLPCLRMAKQAAIDANAAPTILNAANEVAVAAFLERKIAYTDIATVIDHCLQNTQNNSIGGIEDVLHIDNKVRQQAMALLKSISN